MSANVRPPAFAPSKLPPAILSCLRELVAGRVVEIWGDETAPYLEPLADAAELRLAGSAGESAPDILICPDPERTQEFLGSPFPTKALGAGAIVIAWSARPGLAELASVYRAHYVQRVVSGVLSRSAQLAASRVAVLHEAFAEPTPTLQMSLWSNEPLPPLPTGLFEDCSVPPAVKPYTAAPVVADESDERAVALVKRLLEVEDRTLSLRAEIVRLGRASAGQGGAPAGAWFDPPRTRHEWPLAEQDRPNVQRSVYDVRPDDGVIAQAQLGAEFFAAYGLDGQTPDFVAAAAALNALAPALRIDVERPDVSIVIPVYGQLAYTLNCLHSLLLHQSRYSAEIIVIDDRSPDGATTQIAPTIDAIRYHLQPRNGGFIESCNTGGKLANGRYVAMLNNDTRVVEGWLDNLIDSFGLFAQAGLVGSKMLYPDGALQEAGGIVWRDGSAWNYGRNDDPNRPQYCYARQVDYISGCSIALPTALWRELGGFDRFYAPAYAEDADLAQRVVAHGREVWVQPTSRVIHYEGKTSGTQTSDGVKAYQVVNLRKLFLRWRDAFAGRRRNGEAPYFEKERQVRKRILFVDAVTPTPDQDAGSLQTALALRCARRAGYKAHFVPEDNWLFEPKYTPMLQREGVECLYAPFELGFENFMRRYGFLFDAVIVYRVGVMQKCLPLIRQYAPNAATLFHLADLHYLRLQRQAELEQNADLAANAQDLKTRELATILQSDCAITHSTVEADIIAAEAPGAPVVTWPLMMEAVGAKTGFEARRDLCFLGGYRHPPNVDAVIFFVSQVLPLIHAVRPELRLIVAGANPTPELAELANDRVVVTGMVADLAEALDKARVFVCPLRVGAGAKGKVMSALAYGLPVVSTAIGVEGAGLLEGEHVLVADEPQAMADTILRLYDDPVLWRRLSAAGLRLIRDRFSLDMGVERLEEAIEKGHRKRLGLSDDRLGLSGA